MELAIPEEAVGPQSVEKNLAYKLLERMYKVCRNHGIKFIVIDIPATTDGGFRSSFPSEWTGKVELISDAVVHSNILNKHGEALVNVPHGVRHISEYTHGVFGSAVASAIIAQEKNRK